VGGVDDKPLGIAKVVLSKLDVLFFSMVGGLAEKCIILLCKLFKDMSDMVLALGMARWGWFDGGSGAWCRVRG
jgi:hypothetical protein